MKNIILIGTGGLAAELTKYINDKSFGENINLKGYINTIDSYDTWRSYRYDKPYLGYLQDYNIEENDYFVIAIGNINIRKELINYIIQRNGKLTNLIHSTSIVCNDLILGNGNIIEPFCIIGPNVIIGNYNLFTSQSIVSHDTIIGNNNFMASSLFSGYNNIGDDNFFGIRCTTIPSIKIGNSNIIKAGMIVDKNIENNETVFYKYKEKIIAVRNDL